MNANEMTITAKLSAKLKNANQPKQKVTPQKHYEELDELYLESVVGGKEKESSSSSSTISSPSSSTISSPSSSMLTLPTELPELPDTLRPELPELPDTLRPPRK